MEYWCHLRPGRNLFQINIPHTLRRMYDSQRIYSRCISRRRISRRRAPHTQACTSHTGVHLTYRRAPYTQACISYMGVHLCISYMVVHLTTLYPLSVPLVSAHPCYWSSCCRGWLSIGLRRVPWANVVVIRGWLAARTAYF
jgi:hypothetical protein